MDSQQFSHAMSIPHRRPAYGVNAPAAFRHIGYRIEDLEKNSLTATTLQEVRERRRSFVSEINVALQTIQKRCGCSKVYTFTVENDLTDECTLPTLNTLLNTLEELPISLNTWRGRLRVDIHSEYYFVTFILDQKTTRDAKNRMVEDEEKLSTVGCGAINLSTFVQTYYDQIWDDLESHIKTGFDAFPGVRFTEFRSIVLRDRGSPFIQKRQGIDDISPIPEMDDHDLQNSRKSLRHWLHKNSSCVHEILQLQQFTTRADQDANCVLSELLGGAAVYGSSVRLVNPDTTSGPNARPLPLRYFLLYNGLSKYQLGRLVRRTHVMGELRVAAVLDARLLGEASWRIRSLGNRIEYLLRTKGGGATLLDTDRDAVAKEFNEIGALTPGGLLYRVNRSRYYVESFRVRMSDMRVRRLEGWQPYDEFFSRNLYQVFDEIDRIGQRYEALGERITRLTIARNADELNRFQDKIGGLVSELAKTNHDVVSLLQLGDIVGWAAFTYYGGHVIHAVIHLFVLPILVGRGIHPTEDAMLLFSYAIAFLGWTWIRTKILPEHGRATSPAPAITRKSAR